MKILVKRNGVERTINSEISKMANIIATLLMFKYEILEIKEI